MNALRHRRLALLLLLAVTASWRWSAAVGSPAVLPDEQVYLRAAAQVEAGRSPFLEPGYFYPPPLALTIAAVSPRLGDVTTLRLLRLLALAGLTITAWLSLLTVPWRWWLRLLAGIAFLTLAPAVEVATVLGNAAGLAIGLVVTGLFAWPRRPLLGGAALGLGLAIKPVAPLAPLLLAAHRPVETTHRPLLAAATAGAAIFVACLGGLRHLGGLLANARGHTNPYNFSLHRLLADLGVDIPALLLASLVTVVTIAWLARRRLPEHGLLTIAITSSLVALPILWAHSLALLLPVQIVALDRLTRRSRSSGGRTAGLVAILAVLALIATFLPQAVGSTFGLPTWSGTVSRAVTFLATPYLGWFVLRQAPDPARLSR